MNAAEALPQRQGFSGAVSGLTFSDVIQLKGLNRFTGCVSVTYGDDTGKIYFRDGEMIHAEQGDDDGCIAFYRIFQWPSGNFQTYPNITCTAHTIDESWRFLLLEAHRLQDEGKLPQAGSRSQGTNRPEEVAMSGQQGGASTITRQVKEVEGVQDAVLHNLEGVALERASFTQESIAAQASFVVHHADRIGEIFGIGPLRSAAVEGSGSHLLLFESKRSYFSIAIDGTRPLGEMELSVKAALGTKREAQAC